MCRRVSDASRADADVEVGADAGLATERRKKHFKGGAVPLVSFDGPCCALRPRMEFFAAYPPAKTLVTARPFDAGSRTRPDAFADRNDDRRASASSMNKKPAAAPMRLKRTASSAAAEPPRMKNADQLLAKWNKVSQPESDDSDDLNLDFSQERQGRPIKPYPRRSESQTSPPRAKRKSTSYPDMTANHSSSGKHTRKPASFPAADADATDSEAYMVLSQDMEYIASSVPSKNLRLEVSIGVGDGASLADSEGEPSLSTTVTRLDFRSGNKTKKNQSSKSGILPVLRLPISIAYSSDEEGGVRDDSFLQVLGRSAQRKMTAMTVGTKTSSGKGNSKNSMVDGNKSGTGKNKAGRRAAAIDPPRTSNGTGKGKPKGNAKSQGKVIVSTSEESSDDDSDDDVPALRFDRDDYSEPTPRPKKRPMEAAKATTAGVSGRKRKIRHLQDDSNGIASSDDDTDQRSTPMQRRKLDVGGTSAAIARAGGSRSAKGSTLESGKRVSTVTRRGTIQSRARSTTPPPSSSQKTAPHPLLGAATSTTTGKGKDPLRKVTLPDGFPSPMRAPIRPNERLLRAAAAESSSSSSSSSPSRPRAGKSQEGNKERAPDVGPNGVKMLPVFECVPADAPTLQLSMEKVPQLIARHIVDDKCPYCDEFMPIRMGERLCSLFSQLRATTASRPGSASSDADWTRTIEFCQRHHAESHVFPLGFHAGYPHEMNFTQLKARVKALKPDVRMILKKPKNSPFYLFAKKDLEAQGRRKWSSTESTNDEKRKDRLLPGYFGPLGKITIGNVLKGMLRGPRFARLTTPEAIGPLLPEEYIEHVLVIEVALLFIAQDMQQEKEDGETFSPEEKRARALQILKESREYGRQRFGIGSEYIAEEDWGNGATQMVIADVRGLNRDSEDEDENDDDQTTSSDQETETEQQQELQPQPHCGRMNEMDDGSDSGNRATRSSPHRIDDDDDDDDDEIRQALVTPEVLPIDLSPVRSFGARNSHSPIPAADDVDHARTLGSSPPLSNAPRRLDDPISLTHLSDDEFDNPAVTLDNQEVIDAANVVEETFFQNEMRKNASNSATTTPQAARKRPAPKFAEVVDVTSPPARSGAFNHNSRGSRVTRDTGASLVGPRKRNHLNLNQGAVVLDLDGVDPLDNNIGREHQSLASRTQIRPHSAGGRAQSGARSSAGTGLPRSGGSGFSNRPNSGGYQAPNGSPYSYTQGRQGGRQIGLSRIVGSSAASSNGQQGSRRAPHSAGPSGAFGPDRDRAGGARRGGSAVGTTLFHNKTRIQALQNARLDQAMWEKKSGGG